MKDRLLYLTISLLVGVVVVQWSLPSGRATVSTPPVGNIIALAGDVVVTADGDIWDFHPPTQSWSMLGTLPVPADQLHMIGGPNAAAIVDKSGDVWEGGPASWTNVGHPPVPVPVESATFGTLKDAYKGKD